jgi:tRNA dimethylallyltransferase
LRIEYTTLMDKKILCVLGPTATGKTDLAINLAKKLDGELVACDSRQVYKGLDIGAGKSPSDKSKIKCQKLKNFWVVDGVKIWMYDVVSPTKRYDVAQYIKEASKVIEKIVDENKLPIIVGGTGMYLRYLIHGLSSIEANIELRAELEKMTLGEVQKKLIALSPTYFENLNESERKNKRRLIRKIEILSDHNGEKKKLTTPLLERFKILKIGLSAKRELLNKRINQRVVSRIDQGMIEEAEKLYKSGLSFKRMVELGLEYGVLAEYLGGKLTKREMVEKLKTKIHQYAKRQMTWFKRDKQINWFDITHKDWQKKLEKVVLDWYNA